MIVKDLEIQEEKSMMGYYKDTFEYTFNYIIQHLNIICFVVKSADSGLDNSAKYIFGRVYFQMICLKI